MAIDFDQPIFVISVAAELADMHPQTLRQYDRLGIVSPSRAPGKSRRYSQRDVNMLREVQRLSQEGVSLEGIKRILQLENQVAALQRRVGELTEELGRRRQGADSRIFAAGAAGDVVSLARGKRPQARVAGAGGVAAAGHGLGLICQDTSTRTHSCARDLWSRAQLLLRPVGGCRVLLAGGDELVDGGAFAVPQVSLVTRAAMSPMAPQAM
ncbi:hypothetical protein NicSoilC12_23110 [Arthrobacter sp. NicSoilC12]|nr:hypothetical protein NicSoilC12_23110 [Arthrobacter sp. NicSoilC12]